jgi:hypothetical protein
LIYVDRVAGWKGQLNEIVDPQRVNALIVAVISTLYLANGRRRTVSIAMSATAGISCFSLLSLQLILPMEA